MKKLLLLLVLSLGIIGLSYANFQSTVDEYYKKNYETALNEFQIMAEQGNGKAQIYLSEMYKFGTGVDKDEDLAKAWEEKSLLGLKLLADQGDPEAQYWLGYYSEGDEAEIWYKKSFSGFLFAANQGDPYAQSWLSYFYMDGVGVDEDEELANNWEMKAAQGGDAYSQYYLGQNIINYETLSRNDDEAIKWYTKAAEQGHLGAISDLEAIGINVKVTADDNKTDTANNDSKTLLSFKNTMEADSGLSSKRIGKWFIGSDCNNIASEIIVLHDQIMQRPFSTEQTLNVLIETNNEY